MIKPTSEGLVKLFLGEGPPTGVVVTSRDTWRDLEAVSKIDYASGKVTLSLTIPPQPEGYNIWGAYLVLGDTLLVALDESINQTVKSNLECVLVVPVWLT